ncbi:hypothetical protein AVEN_252294-1 [Araneus ventricosus]|uniref:Uncharacterized protein n=1 Tax=Araneus ventricosus TaxID=182803 RepID=A0A4Y2DR74_ARAVE|nr:hypothetical protein AVEN_252294-1 [Araneus ventricosus]
MNMAFAVAFALFVLPFSAVEGTFGVQIFGPHFSPFGVSQSNGWVGLKSLPTHSGASETLNSEYSHALYPIGKHQFLRIPVKGGLKVVPAPRHLDLFKGNHDFLKHDVPLVKKPPLTSFGGYHFRESSHLLKNSERPLISVPGTGNSIILIHGHPLNHHSPLHTAGHVDDVSHSAIHSYKPIKIVKSILRSYPHSKSHPVKFPSSIISSHQKSYSYPSLAHETSHIEGSGVKHDLTHSHHHGIGGSLLHSHKSDVGHSVIPSHHSSIGHDLSHVHHSDIEHDLSHDHHSDTEHDHHSDIAHEVHDHHSDIAHEVHDHHSDAGHEHGLSHGYHSHIGHHLSHGHSHIGHVLPHVHTAHIKHSYHSIHDSDHSEIHDDDDEEEVIEEHGLDVDDEHHEPHIEEEHNSYAKKIRDYKLMRLAKKIHKPITKTQKKMEEKSIDKATDKNSMKKFPPSKHFKNPPTAVKDEKMEEMGEKMEEKMMVNMKEKMIEDMKEKMMENMKEEMMEKMKEEIMENMKEEMIENMNKKMMEKMKEEMMGGMKEEMMGGMKEEMMGGMKEEMMGGMKKEMMRGMKKEMMRGIKGKTEDMHKKMEDMDEKMESMDEKMEDMDEQMEDMDDKLDHVPIPRNPNIKFASPSYIPKKIESSKLHKLEDAYKRFQTSHHRSLIRESKDFRKLHDKDHVHHPTNHEESHPYIPKILKSHEVIKYSGGRHPVRPVYKYVEQKYYRGEEPEKSEDVDKKHMYFRKVPLKVEQQEQLQDDDDELKHEIKTKSDSYGHVRSHSYRESRRSKPVHYEYKSRASLPRGRSKFYRNYEEPHTSSYAVEILHSRRHGNAKKDTAEDRRPIPKKMEVHRHETQQKEEEEEEDFDYLESQLSFTEESLDGQKYGDKLKKE